MAWYLHPLAYAEIWIAAKELDLDYYLLAGLIMQESAFRPHVFGDAGLSAGLGQLHDQGAGAPYSREERMDVSKNIDILTRHLRAMIDATGSVDDGLSAYNQGLGGWQQRGRAINQHYVDSVLAWQRRFAAAGIVRWPPNRSLIYEAT